LTAVSCAATLPLASTDPRPAMTVSVVSLPSAME
jgi:hypothetical protein